ncbi:MAG: hypothetical protein A2Y24_03935 [Clostridiales bacterium GWE2_32_10]|nr:MAG: hypothetical protein A2Y24_03935 [Clostridiales bacterium GWE2_32_10]HBY21356.1 hypothetical protein [Clostridiales bacterium]
MKKFLTVLIMFSICLGVGSTSLAKSSNQDVEESIDNKPANAAKEISTIDVKQTEEDTEKVEKNIKNVDNEVSEVKVRYKTMGKVMNAYKHMLKTMEKLEVTDKESKIERLELKIANLNKSMLEVRSELTKSKKALKEKIMNTYTEEEQTKLAEIIATLEEDKDISVLPYQNVYAKEKEIKFDTPPIIKEGRTLIPIRALATAYGFEVSWNEETNEVTLMKDGNKIQLRINSREAYVNGEKIELDVPAETYNSRTVIPLKFVAEKMGLNVDWDEETQTIDISDSEDEEVAEDITTTTDEETVVIEDKEDVEE